MTGKFVTNNAFQVMNVAKIILKGSFFFTTSKQNKNKLKEAFFK